MAPLCSKKHHLHSQRNKKPDMIHLMGGTPTSLTLSLSLSIFPSLLQSDSISLYPCRYPSPSVSFNLRLFFPYSQSRSCCLLSVFYEFLQYAVSRANTRRHTLADYEYFMLWRLLGRRQRSAAQGCVQIFTSSAECGRAGGQWRSGKVVSSSDMWTHLLLNIVMLGSVLVGGRGIVWG